MSQSSLLLLQFKCLIWGLSLSSPHHRQRCREHVSCLVLMVLSLLCPLYRWAQVGSGVGMSEAQGLVSWVYTGACSHCCGLLWGREGTPLLSVMGVYMGRWLGLLM